MEYKKIQPLLTLSFFFIIGSVAIGYYFDVPLYKKMQEQEAQIRTLEQSNSIKSEYENKIREIDQRLINENWEQKKSIIKDSFEYTPFYLSKAEIFFKDIVLKNGLSFGDVSFSPLSSIKVASSQVEETKTSSDTKTTNFKPQENAQVAVQTGSFANLKGSVNKLDFNLTVMGSYDFLKLLIESMERQAFLISIQEISFSAIGNDGRTTFNIKGEIYSY